MKYREDERHTNSRTFFQFARAPGLRSSVRDGHTHLAAAPVAPYSTAARTRSDRSAQRKNCRSRRGDSMREGLISRVIGSPDCQPPDRRATTAHRAANVSCRAIAFAQAHLHVVSSVSDCHGNAKLIRAADHQARFVEMSTCLLPNPRRAAVNLDAQSGLFLSKTFDIDVPPSVSARFPTSSAYSESFSISGPRKKNRCERARTSKRIRLLTPGAHRAYFAVSSHRLHHGLLI